MFRLRRPCKQSSCFRIIRSYDTIILVSKWQYSSNFTGFWIAKFAPLLMCFSASVSHMVVDTITILEASNACWFLIICKHWGPITLGIFMSINMKSGVAILSVSNLSSAFFNRASNVCKFSRCWSCGSADVSLSHVLRPDLRLRPHPL